MSSSGSGSESGSGSGTGSESNSSSSAPPPPPSPSPPPPPKHKKKKKRAKTSGGPEPKKAKKESQETAVAPMDATPTTAAPHSPETPKSVKKKAKAKAKAKSKSKSKTQEVDVEEALSGTMSHSSAEGYAHPPGSAWHDPERENNRRTFLTDTSKAWFLELVHSQRLWNLEAWDGNVNVSGARKKAFERIERDWRRMCAREGVAKYTKVLDGELPMKKHFKYVVLTRWFTGTSANGYQGWVQDAERYIEAMSVTGEPPENVEELETFGVDFDKIHDIVLWNREFANKKAGTAASSSRSKAKAEGKAKGKAKGKGKKKGKKKSKGSGSESGGSSSSSHHQQVVMHSTPAAAATAPYPPTPSTPAKSMYNVFMEELGSKASAHPNVTIFAIQIVAEAVAMVKDGAIDKSDIRKIAVVSSRFHTAYHSSDMDEVKEQILTEWAEVSQA